MEKLKNDFSTTEETKPKKKKVIDRGDEVPDETAKPIKKVKNSDDSATKVILTKKVNELAQFLANFAAILGTARYETLTAKVTDLQDIINKIGE